jgi:hypothetical protein
MSEALSTYEIAEWEITFCYQEFTVHVMGYSEGNNEEQAISGAEERLPIELGEPLEITAKLKGSFPEVVY